MPSHLLLFLLLPLIFSPATSLSDPPTLRFVVGCGNHTVSDLPLNSTFSNLRSQLSNSSLFATSDATSANSNLPMYSMFYCRPYLSLPSCLSCFANASATIRSCGLKNGARVILSGCFLRYESAPFYTDTTSPYNSYPANCSNASSNNGPEVASMLADLAAVTTHVNGSFAAAVRNGVYAVAECIRTVNATGCNACLQVAVANMKECLGKKGGSAIDVACYMRFSDVDFFGNYPTVDLQSLLSSISTSGKSNHKWAIIGGAVGGSVLLLCALLLFLLLRKSNKLKNGGRGNILGATELRGLVNFRYKDLKSATKNFSDENKLGEGGFGDVYKGVLKNGSIVAVKKLAISQTNRAKADFQTEVTLISKVHHRNLVRLLGCSSKGPDLLLVYEYMANNSLDKFLFGAKHGTLKWKQRYEIIVGIARGIAYFHQEFHVTVIHRDIKCSNILLDDDLRPKIADFGLARLLPGGQTHVTTKFAGTFGYTAPEYAINGQLSEKVDTYSFGIVLLEIISGRKSNDPKLEPEYQYLLEWAWRLYESRELIKLVDESMDPNEFNEDELRRVIEIALLCTQSMVAARPTMPEVVILLLSKAGPSAVPTRPTFINAVNRVPSDTSASNSSYAPSNATVSFTQMSAR